MPDPRIFPVPNVNDTYAAVTNVSTIVLAARDARVDCDLTNDSTVWIYLGRGNDAVIGSGIPLSPNGGTYHIGTANLFQGDIYGIADGAKPTANLAISEGYNPR